MKNKKRYKIKNKIDGIITKLVFWIVSLDMNLIVVSEKIIILKPVKKVISLNLEYFGLSFDDVIRRKGIKARTGI